jgi:PAS domain S-box-containing protein
MPSLSNSPFPGADSAEALRLAAAGKVGLWDWDLVTNEVKWTDSLYALHGVDRATFNASLENYTRLVHPDDLPRVKTALQRTLELDAPYEIEFRIQRPDGKTAWVFANATVLRQDGRAIRLTGATVDITARRDGDEVSRRLAAIVESSDDAIISTDLAGLIATWNAGAQRLFGHTAREAIGRPVTLLIPPAREGEEINILDRIRRGERIEHYETVRQHKDGSLIDVSLTVSPLKDATGHVIGASKIARDITDRKKSEAALRLSEERFRLLSSHAPVGIFLSDARGGCVFVNERWCEMAGLTLAQAQGDGWADALHPADRAGVLAGWREAVAAGHPSTSEFRFQRQDGRVVWLRSDAVQIKEGGELAPGYLGSCVDITERKQAELQAAFLHGLSDQVSGLNDPDQIMDVAQAALGEHLAADRCYFFEMIQSENLAIVRRDWRRPDLPPTAGNHPLDQFGSPEFLTWLAQPRKGIADVMTHPVTRDATAGYVALKMRGLATSTFSKHGRRMLSLAVSTCQPRAWTAAELDLIENITARVWPAIERARTAQALRESEKLHRAIGESIDYGVWVCDPAGRNLYASDSFLKLVGLTQEQCSNGDWAGALHPEEVEATKAAWEDCTKRGDFWEREQSFKGADGQWHPVLIRGVPIRDEAGRIQRWVGINLDIAAFKRSENTSRQRMNALEKLNAVGGRLVAEHELEKIVQAVTDAGREISGAAFGAFFYNVLNEQGESYTLYTLSGVPREAFAKFPMPRATALFGPTFRGEGVVRVADVHQDPRYGKSAPHHGMPAGHLPVRSYLAVSVVSRSGEVLGGLFFGHPEANVFTPEAETVVVSLAAQAAIAIDNAKLYTALQKELAEQRRTEAKLRESEQAVRESERQLRLVTDHAPIFLAHCDRNHRFKFVNRTYAERYGRTVEDIVGRHVAELTGDEAYATFRHHMDNTLAGRRIEFEQEIPYSTLGRRWVHVIYEPERNGDGEVVGLVAVVVDITARKQVELELERARDDALAGSRAKDDFLAALSHELRTPLNPVLLLSSDSANNPALSPEIRDSFKTIRDNISLEARLIDDLLDLTRITRGKMLLEKQRVDIHAVLRDAVANLRAEIEARRLDLELDLAAPHTAVLGDPVRLQQVLWNVLKNAVKFTPEGGRVRINTRLAPDQGRLLIEVVDSGIGMLPAELAQVFEAFAQGEHAGSNGPHRFGGLGLGLTISRKLVEMHDGQIQASSPGRDQGSVFVIDLPLMSAGTPKPDSRPPGIAAETGATASRPAGSILLVEDHASTRETVKKLLTRRHYEVVAAATATAARELAGNRAFDFVVSDVGLPDGDGYELMKQLRKLQPSLQGIAMSGYGMEDDLQRSHAAGFAAHLVKPVSISALEQALARLSRAAPSPSST